MLTQCRHRAGGRQISHRHELLYSLGLRRAMGILKWATRTAYYSTKNATRAVGRSVARDARDVVRPAYEHPGCSIRHRTPEAMLKCKKGY